MEVKIALAGNPNSGKTTLFNALTGSNQFVGNWPGVTVEKKEGKLKGNKDVIIQDLPGIYSLSPYTLEEVVARNYLINERPDAILNIVDGTNMERNLYLSTQLLELGIPMVMAVNMMDVVRKKGDVLNMAKLSEKLGCIVVEISALKNEGVNQAAELAVKAAKSKKAVKIVHEFDAAVEQAIVSVQDKLSSDVAEEQKRFFAVKLLERDSRVSELLQSVPNVEEEIEMLEDTMDDDTESIITNERYTYISSMIGDCVKKGTKSKESVSDKIDKIVTNRILALPIFVGIMILVYLVSVTTVGTFVTDWTNDGLFGDGWSLFGLVDVPGIPAAVSAGLESIGCAPWLEGLIVDGIVGGVGAVLGFVPQMLVLFIMLAFLESCGYMARVAFIMDRILRRFGLSGKSFIPILIGTGCGVPGIMASRTIESDRDRKMTIMTTTFIPCGAKMPIIALIAGAIFGGAWWVAPLAYFVGIAAIVISGIILKKTKPFAGEPAPFVMELPAYHWPTAGGVLRSMWERGWSFIKKAGTIILLSTIVLWFLCYFGWADGQFMMLTDEQLDNSIVAVIGNAIAVIFRPLGFGTWQSTVATITGLIAKENVVATFGLTFGFAEVAEDGAEYWGALAGTMTAAGGMAFMIFNLLCAPCFAAMGAIKREMNNIKWFWAAIGYQCVLAYCVALCVNQLGLFFAGNGFGVGTVVAVIIIIAILYLLFRPYKDVNNIRAGAKSMAAAR